MEVNVLFGHLRFRSNPLALWRGYTALAGRNLPFTALQFPIFERIRESIRRYRDERGIRTHTLLEGGLITAVSAGTGGSFSAVVTTPVDVVKTRIQLEPEVYNRVRIPYANAIFALFLVIYASIAVIPFANVRSPNMTGHGHRIPTGHQG